MKRFPGAALALVLILPIASCRSGRNGAIVASGHVEATEVRVAPEVGGTLQALRIDEGDQVTAGQVLAVIDTTGKHLEVLAARADRDMARAELDRLENGSRREDVAAARARYESATADLKGAETDLERMETLARSGAAPLKARDDARTRRDVTAAAAKAAREDLRRLEAGSRVEDIAAARARLQGLEARLARIEEDLDDAVIESPTPGVVSEKLVEAGEIVSAGTPIALITNLADAWLTAFVAETDLGRIRLGQAAEVVSDDGQRRAGRLTFISPRAEFTPRNVQTRDERVKLVYEIRISIDNRDGLFKPGMPAEAVLQPASAATAGPVAGRTAGSPADSSVEQKP